MTSSRFRVDAVVRVIAQFWIWFFVERVEVRHPERVPRMGPVLLCINHPNNLIDSLLVGSVLPRKVHYLATAVLCRNPLIVPPAQVRHAPPQARSGSAAPPR
jgi:1-acyl-sn-glycerol-3-phosphate acyltransferase